MFQEDEASKTCQTCCFLSGLKTVKNTFMLPFARFGFCLGGCSGFLFHYPMIGGLPAGIWDWRIVRPWWRTQRFKATRQICCTLQGQPATSILPSGGRAGNKRNKMVTGQKEHPWRPLVLIYLFVLAIEFLGPSFDPQGVQTHNLQVLHGNEEDESFTWHAIMFMIVRRKHSFIFGTRETTHSKRMIESSDSQGELIIAVGYAFLCHWKHAISHITRNTSVMFYDVLWLKMVNRASIFLRLAFSLGPGLV